MLAYNKYCKELGLKRSDYPFKELRNNGVDRQYEIMSWNVYWSLGVEIYCVMRALEDLHAGCPMILDEDGKEMTFEKWKSILHEITSNLKEYLTSDSILDEIYDFDERRKLEKEFCEKREKAFKLINDYWECLWW